MSARLFFLLFLFVCSACSTSTRADLEESVKDFYTALRRHDNNRVMAYVTPEKRSDFFFNVEKMDSLHFSKVQVSTIYPDDKMKSALVTVWLEYFAPGSMALESQKRLYSWNFDEKHEVWVVDESSPFGKATSSTNKQVNKAISNQPH